jgi:hypothetical protein
MHGFVGLSPSPTDTIATYLQQLIQEGKAVYENLSVIEDH